MQVLVLEASTTSAKAMLYDAEKGILATKSVPYDASCSDIKTQDANGVADAVFSVGKEIASGQKIDAIALSGIWHSMLICGKDGNPKTRIYTWAYTDAAETAAKLRNDPEKARSLYQRTGCMPNATYPSYRLAYLRNQGIFPEKEDRLTGQGSYLFYRLTGEFLSSVSMASGTGFLNLQTLDWDFELVDNAGLHRENLPALCSHTDCRPLTPAAASLLGLSAGIPVVPAHPDGALNQVGAGAMQPGNMTLSVGTSGAMRMTVPHPALSESAGTWCYYAPGSWLAGAAVSNCTNCIDWFRKTVLRGAFSFSELEQFVTEEQETPPLFLPFLFGERCPGWDDRRTGAFTGLNGFHGTGSLYRAILEGISMSLYQCYTILEGLCGTPKQIFLSGGIIRSPLWAQMLCDLFGEPMTIQETDQASMLGAARLGLLVCGACSDLTFRSAGTGKTVFPDSAKKALYRSRFAEYLAEYQKTYAPISDSPKSDRVFR